MKRLLITTALEETWPEDLQTPVLFLGEWCRLYSRKERWSQMNAEVLPYHWDDREKLYQDYIYLRSLYENLLPALGESLNVIHKVDHTTRYWRILIGCWLGYFIQMLFDRWSMLKCAFEEYEISGYRFLLLDEKTMIPNDMNDFNRYYINDHWNEKICSQLLQDYFMSEIQVEGVLTNNCSPKPPTTPKSSFNPLHTRIKKSLSNFRRKAKQSLIGSDEYFFITTYLPRKIEKELQFRLNQEPKLWQTMTVPEVEVDMKMRQWEMQDFFPFDEFSAIAISMIPEHIPIAYLEGYKSLVDCPRSLFWPKNPKCIFTSNSHFFDDVFKAWAAQKVEAGSKLVIGQHGGHHWIGKWFYQEEHEISIADKYFSWGWSDPTQPKVVPIGQLKSKKPLKVNHFEKNGLLMVCLTMPRYSYHMYSSIMSSQYLNYLDDQFAFAKALPQSFREKLTVRLYQADYGWEQEARWNDRFPNIKLNSGKDDINLLLKECRIYVATYNATTYLESFSMNIPTVIFWDPKHWELSESSKPDFESLKDAGIFHETPESAAELIISIWDDIENWWNESSRRKTVSDFCRRYSNTHTDLLSRLHKEIQIT